MARKSTKLPKSEKKNAAKAGKRNVGSEAKRSKGVSKAKPASKAKPPKSKAKWKLKSVLNPAPAAKATRASNVGPVLRDRPALKTRFSREPVAARKSAPAVSLPPAHSDQPRPREGLVRIELCNPQYRTKAAFDVKLVGGRCRGGVEYFGEFDGAPCALSSGGALNFGSGERDRRRLETSLLRDDIAVGAQVQFTDRNVDVLLQFDDPARNFEIVAVRAWPRHEGSDLVRVGAIALDDERSTDPDHRLRFDAMIQSGKFVAFEKSYGVWVDEGYVNPFSIDHTGVVDFGPLYEGEDRTYRTDVMKGLECRVTSELCWEALEDPENANWVFRIDRVVQI